MKIISIFEYLSANEKDKELCDLYWDTNEYREFIYKVADLAKKFGLEKGIVPNLVKKKCRAYFTHDICKKCGLPVRFLSSREDAKSGYAIILICKKCEQNKEEEREVREEKERTKLYSQKKMKMRDAFESGIYESLSLLEFNFLIHLATSNNIDIARKKVGISKESASNFIENFNNMDLINFNVGIKGYELIPEFEEALKNIKLKKNVKSIFGSAKAKEVYRLLKRKYMFVFPEIPLCSFIEKEIIEHLLDESWKTNYFLTCRIDFIVCDLEGIPEFGVEYQGGYHKSKEQMKKDDFKVKILNEIGLSLRQINYQDLNDEENLF